MQATPTDRQSQLNRATAHRLGRIIAHLDDMPADVAAVWITLDPDTYTIARAIMPRRSWPAMAPGQDPTTVRPSRERDAIARTLRDQIAAVWSLQARATLDATSLFRPGLIDDLAMAMHAVVTSARRAGALTAMDTRDLMVAIQAGRDMLAPIPGSRVVYYIDGVRTVTGPGFDYSRPVRYEQLRPEHPARPGIPAYRDRFRPWVPVATPTHPADLENNAAILAICVALARLGGAPVRGI